MPREQLNPITVLHSRLCKQYVELKMFYESSYIYVNMLLKYIFNVPEVQQCACVL